METLKDTKQHWGKHWGTPGSVEKMPRDIKKKGEFFVSFLKQQGTSRRHQMTRNCAHKCEGDIEQH